MVLGWLQDILRPVQVIVELCESFSRQLEMVGAYKAECLTSINLDRHSNLNEDFVIEMIKFACYVLRKQNNSRVNS